MFASDVFGKGDGGRGLLLAARGLGSALGQIFAMRYARGNLARVVTVCGTAGFVFSLSYLGASIAPSILVACGFIAVAHFGGGAQWTLSTYGLQLRTTEWATDVVLLVLESQPHCCGVAGAHHTNRCHPTIAFEASNLFVGEQHSHGWILGPHPIDSGVVQGRPPYAVAP